MRALWILCVCLGLLGETGGCAGATDGMGPNSFLSGLTVSAGTLSPAFSPMTTAYTMQLPGWIDLLQVTPTVNDAKASVLVNGTPVPSGSSSPPLRIQGGMTMISIAVQISGLPDRVYAIAVSRPPLGYIKASNSGASDLFGAAIALSDTTLVVGAPQEDSNATGIGGNQADNNAFQSGAAYVFVRSGQTWTQQAYLKASNTGMQARFGTSVALSGDTIAVGAVGEASAATGVNGNTTDVSAPAAGAVYVFARVGTTWTQQAYIKASNSSADARFGSSVALAGDTLAVGAPFEDSGATGINGNQASTAAQGSGAVYVFARTAGAWNQQAYVKASNTESNDLFGSSVALSGDTLAVGAPAEDSNATGINGDPANNSARDSGAVYVFARTGSAWTQQAYVKADNSGAGDAFGSVVALSGDTLAVGAPGEASSATGIGGDSADNSALNSGAAYVFARSGSAWAQQAYIKASNSGAGDSFGAALSLSGDTLAVGANLEASMATGIGGNQADNSATQSGAVYVYTRTLASWAGRAYVKADNCGAGDRYGISVALSGTALAVGATGESSNATGIGGNQSDDSSANSGAVYAF